MPEKTETTEPDDTEAPETDSPASEPEEGSEPEVLDLVGGLLAA
ncbi:hypothetical protein [Streptomyces sp. SID10815]|nr:hypothetical protein [Streptomyces sp. SID10815]